MKIIMNILDIPLDIIRVEILNLVKIKDLNNLMLTSKNSHNILTYYIHNQYRNIDDDHDYKHHRKYVPLYLSIYKLSKIKYIDKYNDMMNNYNVECWHVKFEWPVTMIINSYKLSSLVFKKYKDFYEMNVKHFERHIISHSSSSDKTPDCDSCRNIDGGFQVYYKLLEHDEKTQFIKLRGLCTYGSCYWSSGNITIVY